MQTHEAKPHTGPLERVVCQLSIKTARVGNFGGSGRPEFTTSDIASAAAGYVDPVGRHLIGVLLEDARDVDACIEALNRVGWLRWLTDQRKANIDTGLHRRMCEATVAEFQNGQGWSFRALKEYLQIGSDRLRALLPHYLTLGRILSEREGELTRHIARRLRRREVA
jgi:hypothetical protein